MTREAVQSSNIAECGYDPATRVLEVKFRADRYGSSAVWQYADVPADVYADFRAADSIGKAFSAIKAAYEGRKVEIVHADGRVTRVDGPDEDLL